LVDKVYEMTAVEIKGRDPKITWEIVSICRAPNKDMWLLEKLAGWTGYMGRIMKRSISGLISPYADWNGHTDKSRGTQVLLNRLVWENGYAQVVNSLTQGDALLDIYLVRPNSAFISCSNLQGSVIIAGYYWKLYGEKIAVSINWKD